MRRLGSQGDGTNVAGQHQIAAGETSRQVVPAPSAGFPIAQVTGGVAGSFELIEHLRQDRGDRPGSR